MSSEARGLSWVRAIDINIIICSVAVLPGIVNTARRNGSCPAGLGQESGQHDGGSGSVRRGNRAMCQPLNPNDDDSRREKEYSLYPIVSLLITRLWLAYSCDACDVSDYDLRRSLTA